ncbi:Ff.00g102070.m01.CDS01 [Fusarium sp. VM40]|nr:Ff.00g102070.m01.CDS01 [Fusarium sp. VM40]
MTSRNLNKTWRDVIFEQYEADHAADVLFPITYLINAKEWKKDIFIEIPTKIDVPVFRQALLHAVRSRLRLDDPAYEDELIKIRARVSGRRDDDVPAQDVTGQPESSTAGNGG